MHSTGRRSSLPWAATATRPGPPTRWSTSAPHACRSPARPRPRRPSSAALGDEGVVEGRDAPVVALLDDHHRESGVVDALKRPARYVQGGARHGHDDAGGELTSQVEPEADRAAGVDRVEDPLVATPDLSATAVVFAAHCDEVALVGELSPEGRPVGGVPRLLQLLEENGGESGVVLSWCCGRHVSVSSSLECVSSVWN